MTLHNLDRIHHAEPISCGLVLYWQGCKQEQQNGDTVILIAFTTQSQPYVTCVNVARVTSRSNRMVIW